MRILVTYFVARYKSDIIFQGGAAFSTSFSEMWHTKITFFPKIMTLFDKKILTINNSRVNKYQGVSPTKWMVRVMM